MKRLVVWLACASVAAVSGLQESRPERAITISTCEHGKQREDKCDCEPDFVGQHCELKMNCEGWQRYRNGTCISCQRGYSGSFCEKIDCGEHGERDIHGIVCNCDKPYSGKFCDELKTENIYSFYNNKVYLLGPLGALSLIPMCLILHLCEWMAQKRQVKRVEEMLDGQNISVNRHVVKTLLV